MRRAFSAAVLFLALGVVLAFLTAGCSALEAIAPPTPFAVPSATLDAVPSATPQPDGTWPAAVTGSPVPSPRAVSSTTPSGTPVPTPTPVEVRLDPNAQRAREWVLALSDLPPGFVTEKSRVVTNEEAAANQPDPSAVLAQYVQWGRITGFEATYSRLGASSQSGLDAVESVASVYSTPDGARASLADFRARSAQEGAATVSMPNLGDESVAVVIKQTATIGTAQATWVVYAIRIREANLLISVNGYGLAGSLGFDEVLALARVVLSQPRKSLPNPLPTPTPAPTTVAEATPTPTPVVGEPDLEVLSYRAYRAPAGSAVVVVGEARNRGTAPAARVQIAVSLLDNSGNVLAAGSVNAAQLALVQPGGLYPFKVLIDRAPAEWSEVRIQIQPLSAEGAPARYTSLRTEGVTVLQPARSGEGYGLAGDVVNFGDSSAQNVRVVAVAYDSQGRVLDVSETTTQLDPIAAGTLAPFTLIWDGVLTAPPYRYEVFLDGEPG